jgi:outer membrane beta-barrel protein
MTSLLASFFLNLVLAITPSAQAQDLENIPLEYGVPYSFEGLNQALDDGYDPVAAEDDDDAPEDSVRAEQEAVRSGSERKEDTTGDIRRRVIMTIQKKNFLKVGRAELGLNLGGVVNDPFLKRFIIGAALDYHFTEIFALEIQLGYAPIFANFSSGADDPDWKELSIQLRNENSVAPDISKMTLNASAALAFSPIYGKAAIFNTILIFDIFGYFGGGVVNTQDDLIALGTDATDVEATNTQNQFHPTTIIGGGLRVAFNQNMAFRIEGKSMSYIEVINSTTLEMKNNFILQGGVSFFIPGNK